MKKNLADITLLVLHLHRKDYPIQGLEECMKHFEFGEVCLLTDDVNFKHPSIKSRIIPAIRSMEEYTLFFIRDLWRYFDTKFVMTTHPDGFIINPESWTDEFLEYDYIGAPWSPMGPRFRDNLGRPGIGNGGFSLRSKKACKYVSSNWFIINDNEDKYYSNCLDCNVNQIHLKYPPVELALRFAQETLLDKNIKPLGFHNYTQYTPGGKYWYDIWKNS